MQLALFVDQAMVPDPERLMALTHDAFEELGRETGSGLDVRQRRSA
jgi:hypothetical protein